MQDLVIEWKEDGTHLYEQIYQYIRDEIRRGKLLCQEKLPSTRSLAEYLQVSRSTVELAYDWRRYPIKDILLHGWRNCTRWRPRRTQE